MAPSPLRLRFVQSAADVAQLPASRAEVAFAGRSNVGKSSLLNALANRRRLAEVSGTPGRTRLLNVFALEPTDRTPPPATLVDLPGYGFAKVPERVRATWGPMIERYLLEREALRMVFVLVDGLVGPTRLDVQMLEWVSHHGLPWSVVATKHDKVKASARDRRRGELATGCGLDASEVRWVSASTGTNIDRLRADVLELLSR